MMNIPCKALSTLLLTAGVCASALSFAQTTKALAVPEVSEDWRYVIAPYLWLTNINSSVYYGGTEIASASVSSGSVLQSLNIAGMVEMEAHKGNFGVLADLMYASLSNTTSTAIGPRISADSTSTLNQGIYTLAATYTVAKSAQFYMDALLGARIVTLSSSTNFNINGNSPLGLSISTNKTLADPVIGLKGRARLSDSDWFVPFYLDVGGGGSTEVTTQAFLGIGRAYEWGDVIFGVKNLYYNQKTQGANTHMDLFGGALGVAFKF